MSDTPQERNCGGCKFYLPIDDYSGTCRGMPERLAGKALPEDSCDDFQPRPTEGEKEGGK